MRGGFQGWNEAAQRFFIGLELDNSKRYFEANRTVYNDHVRGPMTALLESVADEFGPGKVFRPNRDIRFSADKSPYKTNIAASVSGGGYVSLDARQLMAAGGHYEMSPEQLRRYREAVATETSGPELEEIVGRLEAGGYQIGGEELKRVPAPYPKDHPRARLLRHKRLYYWKSFGLEPWLGTAAAREKIVAAWRDGARLKDWLRRHAG